MLVLGSIVTGVNILLSLSVSYMVIANYVRVSSTSLVVPRLAPPHPLLTTSEEAFSRILLSSYYDTIAFYTPRVLLVTGMFSIMQFTAIAGMWSWRKWGFYLLVATVAASLLNEAFGHTHLSWAFRGSSMAVECLVLALCALFVLRNWKMYE
jgi:hypothetical protein